MTESLSTEEVALLIRARQLLKSKGLPKDAHVKSICEAAGVSRKTGYQWASRWKPSEKREKALTEEMTSLKREHEKLKQRYRELEIENQGRQLAWEIHGVDELLAGKKNTIRKSKRKKR